MASQSRPAAVIASWKGSLCSYSLVALATAKLLVSEIVTNAVLHGEGEIVLRARLDQGRLFAEVIDQGHGFTWTIPEPDLGRTSGWGLRLVAGQADRWGLNGVTTHVWFELNA